MLDIAIVGTGGMMPLPDRYLSSAMLRHNGRLLLIDCGECTQVSLKQLSWGFKAIDGILLTHYHADHISGLPGLLLTIGNSGRVDPLDIIGPVGLKYVYEGLSRIFPELPFEVNLIEAEDNLSNYELGSFCISSLNVEHGVPCLAFNIEIKRIGKFDISKAEKLNIPQNLWGVIQKNGEVEYMGRKYVRSDVLGDERKGIKVSYCTDSRPVNSLLDFIKNADLFICEGMYGEDEKIEKAIEHKHMVFSEAAKLAKNSGVKELILTHYSPSLSEPELYIADVRNIFQNTFLGKDRLVKTILFEK